MAKFPAVGLDFDISLSDIEKLRLLIRLTRRLRLLPDLQTQCSRVHSGNGAAAEAGAEGLC